MKRKRNYSALVEKMVELQDVLGLQTYVAWCQVIALEKLDDEEGQRLFELFEQHQALQPAEEVFALV